MTLLAMLTDLTGSTKNKKFPFDPDPGSVNSLASPSLESAKKVFEQVSKFKSVCYEFLFSCKSVVISVLVLVPVSLRKCTLLYLDYLLMNIYVVFRKTIPLSLIACWDFSSYFVSFLLSLSV